MEGDTKLTEEQKRRLDYVDSLLKEASEVIGNELFSSTSTEEEALQELAEIRCAISDLFYRELRDSVSNTLERISVIKQLSESIRELAKQTVEEKLT